MSNVACQIIGNSTDCSTGCADSNKIKAPYYWHLVGCQWIHRKGTMKQKAFSCHDIIMLNIIWVRSRNCGCLVTWFCYQLIAKPGNKTAAVSWPDPFALTYVWQGIQFFSNQQLPSSGSTDTYLNEDTRIDCVAEPLHRLVFLQQSSDNLLPY